jgi:hypothetical protein
VPASSQSQFRFFQAVAHGNAKQKPKSLSAGQAAEFVKGQSPKGLPQKVGKGMAKDTFDAKKDAEQRRKGQPDVDTARVRRLEQQAGIHEKGEKVGKGAAAFGVTKVPGATRRGPTPRPGKAMRKVSPVGYGQDGVKKGGVASTYASGYLKRGAD